MVDQQVEFAGRTEEELNAVNRNLSGSNSGSAVSVAASRHAAGIGDGLIGRSDSIANLPRCGALVDKRQSSLLLAILLSWHRPRAGYTPHGPIHSSTNAGLCQTTHRHNRQVHRPILGP